jgi:hypothetical protein
MDALLETPIQKLRDKVVFTAKKEAQKLERRLLVSDDHRTVNAAFRRICYMLHVLAQKYVPDSAATFADYKSLLYCTKLLQSMGFKPPLNHEFGAAAEDVSIEIVRNSFEYRHLRNKIMASLSIIADLTEKPAGMGSPDYQRGMREGYRRASDVAIMFLDDISSRD